MLDLGHFDVGDVNHQEFWGNGTTAGKTTHIWTKPRGINFAYIQMWAGGGNGGTGVIGANSTAAGGGGGGSGGYISLIVPAYFLPDILYLSLTKAGSSSGAAVYISIYPDSTNAYAVFTLANCGAVGGHAAGGGAGSTQMIPGFQFIRANIGGQAGIIGGTTVAAAALTHPATGNMLTGGGGGGGLPAAAATGTNGSSISSAFQDYFPALTGGIGSATATVPADSGRHGFQPRRKLQVRLGGTGGASTHGTATGGGLVQSSGGNGDWGCGGGGLGGALTGSSAGTVGKGGGAYAFITCW